jgi:hypothetical protein
VGETGQVQVPAGHEKAFLRDIVKDLAAILSGKRFTDVKLACDLGSGNLNLRYVNGVSPHYEGFGCGIEAIPNVSRGVTRKRQLRDARDDCSSAAWTEPLTISV